MPYQDDVEVESTSKSFAEQMQTAIKILAARGTPVNDVPGLFELAWGEDADVAFDVYEAQGMADPVVLDMCNKILVPKTSTPAT